jgi:hypothetical protein
VETTLSRFQQAVDLFVVILLEEVFVTQAGLNVFDIGNQSLISLSDEVALFVIGVHLLSRVTQPVTLSAILVGIAMLVVG